MPPEAVTETPQDNTKGAPETKTATETKPPEGQTDKTKTPEGTQDKPTTDAKTNDKPAADKTPEKPVVPEKYDLKAPEKSLLSSAQVDKIAQYAKERGFSNEQAQELLNREASAVTEYHQGLESMLSRRQEEWAGETKADKEVGGEKFKESLSLAKSVIDRFGTEQLKKELNATKFGDHPEVVRVFARIGRAMAPDQLVHSQGQADTKPPLAERLYKNHNPKKE